MQENKPISIEDDEITLKELILKTLEFYHELLRSWLLIILITMPFVAYMVYKTFKMPTNYPASLTFMLNEDNSQSSIGGLASLVGIGQKDFNLEKMLALSTSRNIIQRALFEKVKIGKKEDFYANHIIDIYDMQEQWTDSPVLSDFTHFIHDSIEIFTLKENYALKILHKVIIGGDNKAGLLSSEIDDGTGIISMKVASTMEELSLKLVNTIYEKLSFFYVKKSIEQHNHTYILTKIKTDSLKTVLNNTQYQLLNFSDSHRNIVLKRYETKKLQLQRDVQILTIAYGEALKNQQIADFTLQSNTPFIQSIDRPLPPLKASKSLISYLINIIVGSFLGGFLAVSFVMGRKIFRDAMTD